MTPKSPRAVKPVKSWFGYRWMIVSPHQKFEQTLSHHQYLAWSAYKFLVENDDDIIERRKTEGWRAIKVRIQITPLITRRAKGGKK